MFSKCWREITLLCSLTYFVELQSVPVSSGGDDPLPVVQELTVLVPLNRRHGGGVDGAGDLHLVPVPAVDEGLLLLYLWFVLNIHSDLKRIVYFSRQGRQIFVAHLCRGWTAPAVVCVAVVDAGVMPGGLREDDGLSRHGGLTRGEWSRLKDGS